MIITFLYLTQTEEKTKMSSDPAITTLIISATYVAVVSFSEINGVISGSPFNPATSLGLTFAIIFEGNIEYTKHIWVFLIFSYAGSLLAVFLFEYVYKKAMSAVQAVEHDYDDEHNEHQDSLISPKGINTDH